MSVDPEMVETFGEAKAYEHSLNGAWEGAWRGIGWRDPASIRESADRLFDLLHEIADKYGNGGFKS